MPDIKKFNGFTFNHMDVSGNRLDKPAAETKILFDSRGNELMEFINELIDILNSINGADYISAKDIDDTKKTVQFILDKLYNGLNVANKDIEYLKDTFDSLIINAGNSNAEIVNARYDNVNELNFETLGKRLDSFSSFLEDKVNKEIGKGLSTNDYDDIAQTEVSKIKNKAEYTYVDNKVATLSSATPIFVNSTSEMTDITKNYVLINDVDGYIYTHNGTSFIPSNVKYQGNGIAEKTVGIRETKYLMAEGIASKNLFTEWELGSFNNDGNKIPSNDSIRTKYYIEVESDVIYTIRDEESINSSACNAQYVYEYDSSKNFIKYTLIRPFKQCQFKTSPTTKFINFSSQSVGTMDYVINDYANYKTQIEVGEEFTGYTTPNPKVFVTKENMQPKIIGINETEYLMPTGSKSPNLFDGEVEYGSFLYTDGSRTPANDVIRNKNIIPVKDYLSFNIFYGKIYDICHIFEYDINKILIKYTTITKTKMVLQLDVNTRYINFKSQASSANYVLPTLDFYKANLVICQRDMTIEEYIDGYPKTGSKDILPKAIKKEHLADDINFSGRKLPSYYNTEIERVRNKVSNDITNAKCSVFVFITDQQSSFNEDKTHNMLENYTNINYLADYVPFNFIANGGDFINGNTPKANTIEELKQYAKLTFETSVVPYGIVRGNHDDNSYYAMNNGCLYDDLITPLDWYKNVIKYIERYPQFVFDDDNREGGYYYYDDENAKIRYIWINTYDTPAIRNNDGTYKYDLMHTPSVSNKQIQWLAHKALNFSSKENANEWAVVGFSHYVHGTTKNYGLLLNVLNAYEKGIAYTGSTTDVDFACTVNVDFTSQGKGEFITFICGDTHEDRGFSNLFFDINLITRRSSLADNYDAPRPIKTDQQDAFDIVVVDRETKQIRTTRFGSGEDVVFNYETYTPKYIP